MNKPKIFKDEYNDLSVKFKMEVEVKIFLGNTDDDPELSEIEVFGIENSFINKRLKYTERSELGDIILENLDIEKHIIRED